MRIKRSSSTRTLRGFPKLESQGMPQTPCPKKAKADPK